MRLSYAVQGGKREKIVGLVDIRLLTLFFLPHVSRNVLYIFHRNPIKSVFAPPSWLAIVVTCFHFPEQFPRDKEGMKRKDAGDCVFSLFILFLVVSRIRRAIMLSWCKRCSCSSLSFFLSFFFSSLPAAIIENRFTLGFIWSDLFVNQLDCATRILLFIATII